MSAEPITGAAAALGYSEAQAGSLHGLLQLATAAPGLLIPLVLNRFKDQRAIAALAKLDGLDIDEESIATALAATLLPTIRDVVHAAVQAGGTPDAVADAVVDRLATALATPKED